jgi:hypothetical protein
MKQKESVAAKTFAPAAAQQQGQSALLRRENNETRWCHLM